MRLLVAGEIGNGGEALDQVLVGGGKVDYESKIATSDMEMLDFVAGLKRTDYRHVQRGT